MSNETIATQGLSNMQLGFADPVFDSQSVFRSLLEANSYAGRIHPLTVAIETPSPLHVAATAVALTLCDFDTAIWLDAAAAPAKAYLQFHCGSAIVAAAGEADFAIVADPRQMPRLDTFAMGEDRYPDRSATLIIQVPSLTEGPETTWSGPGIEHVAQVRIAGLADDFWQQWQDNHEAYPLGVDVIFASGNAVIGLPRSIKVEA